MRDDWKPEPEDDPAGRDRGQRTQASLDEELREWDALWDDVTGAWEARQARWLTRMQRAVKLIDVSTDVDQPKVTNMLLVNALKRLELVRAAPCLDDLATVDEWGEAG